MEQPEEELIVFGKTGLLAARESETLEFKIKAMDLSSYDEANSS